MLQRLVPVLVPVLVRSWNMQYCIVRGKRTQPFSSRQKEGNCLFYLACYTSLSLLICHNPCHPAGNLFHFHSHHEQQDKGKIRHSIPRKSLVSSNQFLHSH